MKCLGSIQKRVRNFASETQGSVGIMFGLVASTVVMSSFYAYDYSVAVAAKSKVQSSLDSTLLYLSKSDAKYDPQAAGSAFLLTSTAGLHLESVNATFEWIEDEAALSGRVEFVPDNILAGHIGLNHTVTVEAKAAPKMLGLVELALVLDSSGSMAFPINNKNATSAAWNYQDSRMYAMDEAVEGLFDAIYENPNVTPKVSVIPYANTVDISDLYVNANAGDFVPTNGRSASSLQLNIIDPEDVEYHDFTDTGLMRKKGIWATERYQSENSSSFTLSLSPPTTSDTLIPITSQRYTEKVCSRRYGCYLRARRWVGDYRRYRGYYFPQSGVLPLSTNETEVRDFVKSLKPEGGTAGHLGAIWGLYSLSADWNDIFNHPAGTPSAFGDQNNEKHLVVMTDGQFNSPQTAGMSTSDIFKYFQSVCDLAAENGVTVYTVGLLLQSDQMDQVLSECVTSPHRYYKVDSKDELIDAFKNIGRVTTQARIAS